LVLIFKPTDGTPLCVSVPTVVKLFERKWTNNDVFNQIAINVANKFVIDNLNQNYTIIGDISSGVYSVRDSLPPYVSVAINFSINDNTNPHLDIIEKYSWSVLVSQVNKVNIDTFDARVWNEDIQDWKDTILPFNHSDFEKSWVEIEATQCADPWYNDMISFYQDNEFDEGQDQIIKNFYEKLGVSIFDIKKEDRFQGNVLCEACNCSDGFTWLFFIPTNEIPKMLEMGFKISD